VDCRAAKVGIDEYDLVVKRRCGLGKVDRHKGFPCVLTVAYYRNSARPPCCLEHHEVGAQDPECLNGLKAFTLRYASNYWESSYSRNIGVVVAGAAKAISDCSASDNQFSYENAREQKRNYG
jgi:hypothetical protein